MTTESQNLPFSCLPRLYFLLFAIVALHLSRVLYKFTFFMQNKPNLKPVPQSDFNKIINTCPACHERSAAQSKGSTIDNQSFPPPPLSQLHKLSKQRQRTGFCNFHLRKFPRQTPRPIKYHYPILSGPADQLRPIFTIFSV